MVAVMTGMGRQEYWSVGAAASAILGMALVFAIWWWYFDGAGAVGERMIRSTRDAVAFHVWSYAHLPLFLAIAVTGVGIERVIVTATNAPLSATEGWILCSAVAVLMLSIVVIELSTHGTKNLARTTAPAAIAGSALLVGSAASHVMPPLLVGALTVLSAGQLTYSLRRVT
jgi:low temperature requirement protein LtrA